MTAISTLLSNLWISYNIQVKRRYSLCFVACGRCCSWAAAEMTGTETAVGSTVNVTATANRNLCAANQLIFRQWIYTVAMTRIIAADNNTDLNNKHSGQRNPYKKPRTAFEAAQGYITVQPTAVIFDGFLSLPQGGRLKNSQHPYPAGLWVQSSCAHQGQAAVSFFLQSQ